MKWLREFTQGPRVVWKIADRYTRGIPDCFALFQDQNSGELVVLFVEFKRPGEKQTAIQESVFGDIQAIAYGVASRFRFETELCDQEPEFKIITLCVSSLEELQTSLYDALS